MPTLTIDGRSVEVQPGTTILQVARQIGIEIPTLCFWPGLAPGTHCMLCVVKVSGLRGLVPSCGTVACEATQVITEDPEIRQSRQAALELLLSDHVGDCMAPCQLGCPCHMHIPRMLRALSAGDTAGAIEVIKRDIALPAVLGRICPAPCEKACRRGKVDQPVSICLLKRFAADADLASVSPYQPCRHQARSKRVAVIGAGPAGLAAAYHLQADGFDCTILDDRERPGGMLRYGVPSEALPAEVLEQEIGRVVGLGVELRTGVRVGRDLGLDDLLREHDAVFVGIGSSALEQAKALDLDAGPKGLIVDAGTYQTSRSGVFAGGDAVRNRRLAVRSVADAKEAALCIRQFLTGQSVAGPDRPFNTHMGSLTDQEQARLLALANPQARLTAASPAGGLLPDQAVHEATRCLHCDCRKADACRLRRHSQAYDARPSQFKGHRRPLDVTADHPEVIYESGKCIHCGLCVQITEQTGERLGLAFIGRGFGATVAVPFDAALAEGLTHAARLCVEACPTGSLAFKRDVRSAL
jgi:ferredoxin